MKKNINIAIVDDDKLVVQLLNDFLNQENEIIVSMTAFSGNAFIEQLETCKIEPDIVLLDLRMNDGDGLETLHTITKLYPLLKIIVLSSYYKASFLGTMLKAGIHAFIPKETDKKELLFIINQVYIHDHYFTSAQVNVLRNQITHKAPKMQVQSKDVLSKRELEVLILICQQYTAKEIAEQLFVTTKTIEAHKSNLLLKTGVKNTAGLIIYAIQNELVNPNTIVLLD
jgi:DNA-binding NarL/FixJ family response regulator